MKKINKEVLMTSKVSDIESEEFIVQSYYHGIMGSISDDVTCVLKTYEIFSLI